MRIDDVVKNHRRNTKRPKRAEKRSDFEKNMTKLRGKERKLDAKKPVTPISID